MQEGLKRQRTSVVGAEENSKWLTDNSPDDREMRPNVRNALSKVYTALDSIDNKLADRKTKLNNAVMRGQEFDASFNDINEKIASVEFQAQRKKPVSPFWPETLKQQQEQKEALKEISSLKPLYDQLMVAAEKVVNSLEPGEEKDSTIKNVDDIKKRWDDVSKLLDHRDKVIDEVEPEAQAHHSAKTQFTEWLPQAEEKLKELDIVPTTKGDHLKLRKAVKEFTVDVEDHIPSHDKLNDTLDKLDKIVTKNPDDTTSTSVLRDDADKLNKRWDKLSASLEKEQDKVNKFQPVITKYFDDYTKAEKSLDDLENALEYQPSYGVDEEIGKKELERIEELMKERDVVKEEVNAACDDSKDLEAVIEDYDGDNSDVKEKTKKLVKQLKDIDEVLNARKADVEKKNKIIDQFNNKSNDIEERYIAASKKLADVGSVKQDPEQVKAQLATLKELEDEINRTRPTVQSLQDAADWLVDNNAEDKVTSGDIKARYANLANPFNELADKINDKQNLLQQALLKTLEFEDTYSTCLDQIEELTIRLNKYDPLSVKHVTLRKQDENFKAYEVDSSQMEPIYEQVLKTGKDVKEGAEDKTEKDNVDKKLKDLTNKKDALTKSVKDRRRNIDSMLPLAKNQTVTQDQFKPLLSELEEQCEEVKKIPETLEECESQLEKVNYIKSKLDETKPKHKGMNEAFDEEMVTAKTLPEVSEESLLASEVTDLNKRWDKLQADVPTKQDQLNKLKYGFAKYEEAIKPVEEDICKFEQVLDQEKPFRLDVDEGKKHLDEINDILKKLDTTDRNLEDTNQRGKELTDQLEKVNADPWPITTKLADTNKKVDDIKRRLNDRKDEITDQLKDLEDFQNSVKEMDDLLNTITDKQEKLEPISTEPEVIKSQLAEVQSMLDEVDSSKPKVDNIKDSAEKVCKNNPGDFSVSSETGLNAKKIEEPLERIAFKLNDRKAKLEKLLVSTQELQDTIDDFSDKLTKVEKDLEKAKPISARHPIVKKQQTTNDQLLEDTKQIKPAFKVLEATVEKVSRDAEPKEREQVAKKIDALKERWETSRDKLEKRKEVINTVVPLAKQYEELSEPLVEFITATEKELAPITDDILLDKPTLESEIDKLKVHLSYKLAISHSFSYEFGNSSFII